MNFHAFLVASGLAATLFLTQCTLQKRLYTRGWHIERSHGLNTAHTADEAGEQKLHLSHAPLLLQPAADTVVSSIPACTEPVLHEADDLSEREGAKEVTDSGHVPSPDTLHAMPDEELPMAPAARAARITGLVSGALSLTVFAELALLLMLSKSAGPVLAVITLVMLGVAFALIPVTLVLAFTAYAQQRRNPGMHSKKTGIGWLSLACLLMALTGMLGAIYLFS